MKELSIFYFLIGFSYNTFSIPLTSGCWIPESYVKFLASMSESVDVRSTLKPFANILVGGNAIAIKPYGGEDAIGVEFRKIGSRIELLHIERIINESEFAPKEIEMNRFYLCQAGDILILTIEGDGKKKEIRFVKEFRGYQFKNFYDAAFRVRIAKNFSINAFDQTVAFTIDGWIKDHPKWLKYELVRDYPYVASDLVVTLVKIIGLDTRKDYAIYISKDHVELYDYEWREHDIVLSQEPVYSLRVLQEK